MLGSAIASAVHLLGLGIGLGSVFVRGLALRRLAGGDPTAWKQASNADGFWGLAALMLIPAGLARAFGGLEKGSAYYLANPVFITKIVVVGALVLLELWPMIVLIQWRLREGKGGAVDFSRARTFATISFVETALIVVVVVLASLMAHGVGA
jgi:putative membrane protein